jgi:hypothetical protein
MTGEYNTHHPGRSCEHPQERTAKEFEELFAAAGFKLLRVIPTDLPTSIVEGAPV